MLAYLTLLNVLCLVAASPIDNKLRETELAFGDVTRNSALEEQLLNALEDLRQTMLTGSDDIPVLDPLLVDYLVVDENDVPVPGLNLAVRDATVNKLSTFVVDGLTLQRTTLVPLRYRLTFDAYIPVLEVHCEHYDLSVPVDGLTIFGSGDAKINIIEPRITASMIVRPTVGFAAIYIYIQECEIKFSLKDFQPRVNGLLGAEGAVTDFINTFLQHLVVDIVQLYEDEITETLSAMVLEIGNEILSDLNLFDIIGNTL